jgi:hypothetical protein
VAQHHAQCRPRGPPTDGLRATNGCRSQLRPAPVSIRPVADCVLCSWSSRCSLGRDDEYESNARDHHRAHSNRLPEPQRRAGCSRSEWITAALASHTGCLVSESMWPPADAVPSSGALSARAVTRASAPTLPRPFRARLPIGTHTLAVVVHALRTDSLDYMPEDILTVWLVGLRASGCCSLERKHSGFPSPRPAVFRSLSACLYMH